MIHRNDINSIKPGSLILLGMLLLSGNVISAQTITIGGDVYGGGKEGQVLASGDAQATSVTIVAGNLKKNVYGGGEKGDSKGKTEVIVKGGNISGSVFGGAKQADVEGATHVKLDGQNANKDIIISNVYGGNDVSGTISGKALVESTRKAGDAFKLFVDNLYGGGNGDYDYANASGDYYNLTAPDIEETTIDLKAGCFGQVFGGGNNATVTGSTTISLNNATETLKDKNGNTLNYQFGRVFGGNNKVAMAIRPTWDLEKASIENLYSGGNKGAMTCENGIILAISSPNMTVYNLYGGCRMADVHPQNQPTAETAYGHQFAMGYAAKVLVSGGKITNVYGGNDISGNVYFGSNVEILSSIIGDVYGGGNGSYTYTDVAENENDEEWGDYYYNPGSSSVDSLNIFRPNAANVLLHIAGTEAKPTYIGGSVYCGGNSATLSTNSGDLTSATAAFKIGSYAIMNNVFLGSNGENMITSSILNKYKDRSISSLDLTNATIFDKYMKGVEVAITPDVSFDEGYVGYSTKIGSLYCGGNVGSMSAPGTFTINFLQSLVIFNKLVGGCNNANVAAVANQNAAHKGGLTTHADTKVQLNISGVKLEPMTLSYNQQTGLFSFTPNYQNSKYIGGSIYGGCYESGYIDGSTVINITENAISDNLEHSTDPNRDDVTSTALSAFGGGYGVNSEVRGNTTINISNNGQIVKVFGGGEMGSVTGNATINLTSGNIGKIYGGGFEGLVSQNTAVYLDGGNVYDAFAGACNANIGGSAKILLGSKNGNTHVSNNVYGGNDFGGTIMTAQENSATVNGEGKTVKSNTFVKYLTGKVDGNIFGGSCGSYDYSQYTAKTSAQGFAYPLFTSTLTGGDINTNSFVDIECESNLTDNIISGGVFGGGEGRLNTLGIVDMKSTYVLLNSSESRNSVLVNNVYGGGYYSKVDNTKVDAVSGYYGSIFGGTFGATATTLTKNYACEETNVNTYGGLTSNTNLVVYGGGSYVGSKTTNVNLYGGVASYVYGGSFNEGYCQTTNVNVPDGSDVAVRGLFGGGKGSDGELPCDVDESNVTFASGTAFVSEAIYGGNHSERATKNANITISSPVYKNTSKHLSTVYGGGLGANTITGTTAVSLEENALVANVFGGGQDGKVYNAYDLVAAGASSYYPSISEYAHWNKNGLDYNSATIRLTETEAGENKIKGAWTANETVNGITFIDIKKGASITENVYGGGYGAQAIVTGSPYVKLNGGSVEGNIYGGGYSGPVRNLDGDEIVAYCQIYGGSVNNVYGGGFKGDMGTSEYPMSTMVEIGTLDSNDYFNGCPTVLRSAYGGGEEAAVNGTSRVKMAGGYIGYIYEDGKFNENLGEGAQALKNNGNLYGAGYGEGAVVDYTKVYMYGGTVRNGMYGGGEIAAVGHGTTTVDGGRHILESFVKSGATHIYMYGGRVIGDIFGGGRGFSYDNLGNEVIGNKIYTDGYVFGSTEVNIYRGSVGTQANIKDGFGNVFGGGNIGYVYADPRQKNNADGYYYQLDGNGNPQVSGHLLSEDCKVLITAYTKVLEEGLTINGHTYHIGDYVPTEDLHTITREDASWGKMDSEGIIVENAVFAGGNVSSGSDKIYANATTIYGNATASIVDLYPKDLILVSNDGIGGLYGDGNLTFVDGYRELNITNYGTDYYSLNHQLSIEDYEKLNRREKSYYELKYKCKRQYTSNGIYKGETILKDTQIPAVEWEMMDDNEKDNYEPGGFTTLYSGRMMNTIQRTDFCGVFGSRIILRGAQDRVPDVVDYTKYTINRVGELSLNQSTSPDGGETKGNYFGIFNVVNLLGAVTSDVDFGGIRQTTSVAHPAEGGKSYMQYKADNVEYSYRNNGSSPNMIALASGVFLEVVDSINSDGKKCYGPVTGVIELDLVNVKTGEGGGYVYAKNIHTTREETHLQPITLAAPNANAISLKAYRYVDPEPASVNGIQTSGNFVHSAKRIVDDCHPSVMNHHDEPGQCHYWYIKGDFYVYNQYISAYTSASEAFTEKLKASMVVTPQANGRMELVSVKPNHYAYFIGKSHTNGETHKHYDSLTKNDSIYIESTMTQYKLNDPISDWDWSHLSAAEKQYFTDSTYVVIADAEIGGVLYSKGDVLLPKQYEALPENGYDWEMERDTTTAYLVRETNALSNQRGFLLTLDFNNPEAWDKYYTLENPTSDPRTIVTKTYNDLSSTEKEKYLQGATLECSKTGIYGQQDYDAGFVISEKVYSEQSAITSGLSAEDVSTYTNGEQQATFSYLWVAKEPVEVTISGNTRSFVRGGHLTTAEYNDPGVAANRDKFCQALYCTKTINQNGGLTFVYGEIIAKDSVQFDANDAITGVTVKGVFYPGDFSENFSDAYICEQSGKFGGKFFEEGINYQAVEYCDLDSVERRKYFEFNYDAFDALRADFVQDLDLYSKPDATKGTISYRAKQPISYQALAVGNVIYYDKNHQQQTINNNQTLLSEDFEELPNEMMHWRPINHKFKTTYRINQGETITIGGVIYSGGQELTENQFDALSNEDQAKITPEKENVPIYVVKSTILIGDKQYTSGHTITEAEYLSLDDGGKANVDKIKITVEGRVYYCVEEYEMGERGGFQDANTKLTYWPRNNDGMTYDVNTNMATYSIGNTIPVGTVIAGGGFTEARRTYEFDKNYYTATSVPNAQQNFQLIGDAPTEISTLYVPRQSVILDYNEDRIVTVIYQYNYTEVYDNGLNTETQQERHIFNIRIHLEDGVPTIGEIPTPATVLPSSTIGINTPSVKPGAFNIIGGGWEIFENEHDAKLHRNGQPYENNATKMYWYNDGYQVEYYAKTYAGKTYSNPVTLSVANYHRLEEVMSDPEYLHIDTARVKRAPKIYVDDHTLTSDKLSQSGKNELDLLYDLFALSIDESSKFNNDGHITGLHNTEIIIQSDVAPSLYTDWSTHQLGNSNEGDCFGGIIHGQGHTINGLNASLIGVGCDAKVYNLGVTGSFTKGGISDKGGYAENTWVATTGTTGTNHPIIAVADPKSIVNSYYDKAQFSGFTSPDQVEVIGRAKIDFLKGNVAYDLNRNYLEKRYQDTQDNSADGYEYKYMQRTPDADTLTVCTSYYSNSYASFLPWNSENLAHSDDIKMGYIERYYSDGDYRYAQGEIRPYTDERENFYYEGFMPIWPDDYILFGQTLTYDLAAGEHDEYPTATHRESVARYPGPKVHGRTVSYENISGRLDAEDNNRVFRAQGYFKSSQKGDLVYFNDRLALDDSYQNNEIHHDLTALDLTGYNASSPSGKSGNYMPELDYDGLISVRGVEDLTRNLLIYAPAADNTSMTVLKNYFKEPVLANFYDEANYGNAQALSNDQINNVYGHVVALDGSNYVSVSSQFLVDLNDFNAPIAYSFTDGTWMWYQRKPTAYVQNAANGWESISLPFTADVVTTQDKGVITHFYEGEKLGHEYWLRSFNKVESDKAMFKSLAKADKDYTVNNTFLWDYYYSNMQSQDKNTDIYQEYYSEASHTYKKYPFYTAAVPYLIGWPGSNYYEFDLSGNFEATTALPNIPVKLGKQTITFISVDEAQIAVSDTECNSAKVTADGYTFVPNYLANTVTNSYLLNNEGTEFAAGTETKPFRAYFTAASASPAQTRGGLYIGYVGDENEPMEEMVTKRGLIIKGQNMTISIESTLEQPVIVDITTSAGRVIKRVTVEPGAKITVPVNNRGVYIVAGQKIGVTK